MARKYAEWGIIHGVRMLCVIASVITLMYLIAPNTFAEDDEDLIYLDRINRAFVKLVNRSLPSIVQIDTKKTLSKDPHEGLWNLPFRFREPEMPWETAALGSGVIVSKDGYILTNNHVIEEADKIIVTLADKRQFDAELIGTDKYTEIAVIKIEAKDLPVLSMGDSDKLQVGEWVIAIGSPFRLAQTVTRGTVSAKGRSQLHIVDRGYEDFIQTDAAINPGNSGGALINIRGELVGINTAILTGGFSRANAGVGFAIPINMARVIMESLIRDGRVIRGWLGVGIESVTDDIAQELDLELSQGAHVTEVYPGPAEEAGIQHNDVIIRFNGKQIEDQEHLRKIVAATQVGSTVDVQIIRNGKKLTLPLKVAERTEAVLAQTGPRHSRMGERFSIDEGPLAGIGVQALTPELADELGYTGLEGVVVTQIKPGSPAADAGIQGGDLIQEIERKDVKSVADFRGLASKFSKQDRVMLYVNFHTGTDSYVILKRK